MQRPGSRTRGAPDGDLAAYIDGTDPAKDMISGRTIWQVANEEGGMKTRMTSAVMAVVFAFGMLGPAWTSTAIAQNYRNDQSGYRYDQYGNRYDQYGNRVDASGNRTDRYGNRYDQQNNGYDQQSNRRSRYDRYDRSSRYQRNGDMTLRAGTNIDVRLDSRIETDEAQTGQTWTGTIARDVFTGGRVVLSEGSRVEGVVTMVENGTHETRPQLALAVREVAANGDWVRMNAETETIVGDSQRAKKIGAVVGGAAVGGILGHAIGGDKGSILGGLLGGAAGYGATQHAFRSMVLKPGTVITFTVSQDMTAYR
jgi:hypothetical protein